MGSGFCESGDKFLWSRASGSEYHMKSAGTVCTVRDGKCFRSHLKDVVVAIERQHQDDKIDDSLVLDFSK